MSCRPSLPSQFSLLAPFLHHYHHHALLGLYLLPLSLIMWTQCICPWLSRWILVVWDMTLLILYVDGCFSFCLYDAIMNFLNNRTNIWIWRQAFACSQHGFLRSKENVVLYNFETTEDVWENVVFCNILTLYFLKHYSRQILCLNVLKADVICHIICGRCCNHWGRCYILILFISGRFLEHLNSIEQIRGYH